MSTSLWIIGQVQSGKTTRLVAQYQSWLEALKSLDQGTAANRWISARQTSRKSILTFAANTANRIDLGHQITNATAGQHPVNLTTPLGFFQDEVVLFWPLLIQQLNLKAQFPLRLRPETEQELATQLWQPELDAGLLQFEGVPTDRLVRQALDLLQLAALSGTAIEQIRLLLLTGYAERAIPVSVWDCYEQLLVRWRNWCLERGLLTYGILSELYWRYLLPHPVYRQQLMERFWAVLADDVDNYPAIARNLFDLLLDQGANGAFTFNPQGGIRLGLGADPQYLSGLSQRCTVQYLPHSTVPCLRQQISYPIEDWFSNPSLSLPESIQSIQTSSRAQLLRQTADTIIEAVGSGQVEPQDIAVIGPGLDAIARYTLSEILTQKGIAVESLNDQRPLASTSIIRALLTLLVLVYPGLGHLVTRDDVAEMLIVLSKRPNPTGGDARSRQVTAAIDPVRAGLLADYCFEPHPQRPRLLSATAFPRWDRLGYQAKTTYDRIVQWLAEQQLQREQRLTLNPISILDRAIQQFLWPQNLPYDQLAALRELMETAQHYWEVNARLHQSQPGAVPISPSTIVGAFVQLLRRGAITANPFPVQARGLRQQAVTLATTFQYRSIRQTHRWHFWLDAGSSLWQGGGAVVLLGAPFFLKDWSGEAWTTEIAMQADQEQLCRLLLDLLSRVQERVYLCHSDLAVSGQEQAGPLLPLVDASTPSPAVSA